MKLNKKATALLLGLTLGLSGTAFAADGADSFSDVPQGHWAYDALDYLAKDGVIDGMGDGTFQGNRTMTRYEMASIVAKAMQKGGLGVGDQAVLEKLEKEYGTELAALKGQVDQNTKDINDLKNGVGRFGFDGMVRVQYDYDKDSQTGADDTMNYGNRRFYFNLNGSYKVNDNWKAKFQVEKNAHYTHQKGNKDNLGETGLSQDDRSGKVSKGWSGHDGNIQRIWVEGYNPHSGAWISIGRAWRGLGCQNVFQGGETDGFQAGVPVTGTHLTVSPYWFRGTGDGTNTAVYGLATWGNIGHRTGINLAYAKTERSKSDAIQNGIFSNKESAFSNAFVLSGWLDVAKDLRFITDYTKTNAEYQNHGLFLRLNYRNTDLQKPHTYQLYTRYFYKGANSHVSGDDEWGTFDLGGNRKGWILGFKYVPWTNVEWETFYSHQQQIHPVGVSDWGRNLVRTQMDFHF